MLRFLIVIVLLLTSPLHAESIGVPGTKISLEPPASFRLSSQFTGFERLDLGASIVITTIPGAYEESHSIFNKENLATRGMALVAEDSVTISERPARLLLVDQWVNGIEVEKWMGLFGNEDNTMMIVATYPKTYIQRFRDPMRAAVLSAFWSPEATIGHFDGLPFSIEEGGQLAIQDRLQNMLILKRPGAHTSFVASEPTMIVGPSIGGADTSDIERLAKQRVAQTAAITDLEQVQGAKLTIDDYEAYEITAKARHDKSGEALQIYQFLMVDGNGYYLAEGRVGAAHFEEYLPEFRRIAHSIKIQ